LKPPLDQYEVEALRMRVGDQRLDAATLHHIFVTFPKQADCEIVQNPNALGEDIVSIWSEHICSDDYHFVVNPNTPAEIVRSIFDSYNGKTLDGHADMDPFDFAQGKLSAALGYRLISLRMTDVDESYHSPSLRKKNAEGWPPPPMNQVQHLDHLQARSASQIPAYQA
jgi:hypothetical protein